MCRQLRILPAKVLCLGSYLQMALIQKTQKMTQIPTQERALVQKSSLIGCHCN